MNRMLHLRVDIVRKCVCVRVDVVRRNQHWILSVRLCAKRLCPKMNSIFGWTLSLGGWVAAFAQRSLATRLVPSLPSRRNSELELLPWGGAWGFPLGAFRPLVGPDPNLS